MHLTSEQLKNYPCLNAIENVQTQPKKSLIETLHRPTLIQKLQAKIKKAWNFHSTRSFFREQILAEYTFLLVDQSLPNFFRRMWEGL